MESIGNILRAARHQRNLSLDDVAEATKIRLEHLEKIEADEFDQLPSGIYARSFLKKYAEFLNLDSAPILTAYQQRAGATRKPTIRATAKAKPTELRLNVRMVSAVVGAVTLGVLLAVVAANWRSRPKSEEPQPQPTALSRVEFDGRLELPRPAPVTLDVPTP
jgi:cytoskeletal protein RodZ